MRTKHKWHKWITLTIVFSLIVSLIPLGAYQNVTAAPGDRNGKVEDFVNFILDTTTKNSLGSPTLDSTLPKITTEDMHFYRYSKNTLNVSGSTNGIKTSDPVFVKVEQLVKNSTTNRWDVVADLGNSTLIIDPSDTRKFAGSISLRDGMHRLTFTGRASDGITTISEVTYVRYDSNIVLNSMKLIDGNEFVEMDGIVPSASKNNIVMVEIKATNATRVILNGREYTPYNDDTFLVGPINLAQGKNNLQFRIENKEGTQQNYAREVYLYDPNTLFVDGEFAIPNTAAYKNAFRSTPSFAINIANPFNGNFKGKMLVPYTGNSTTQAADIRGRFGSSTVSLSGTVDYTNILVNSNVQLVRGSTGMNYAIYTVDIPFNNYTPSGDKEIGTLRVVSDYISTSSPSNRSFSFRLLDQSKTYVTQISYVPTGGTKVALNPTTAARIATADVDATTFEVEATTDLSGRAFTLRTPYRTYTGTFPVTASPQTTMQFTIGPAPLDPPLASGEYTISISANNSEYVDGRILIDTTPVVVFKNFSEGIKLDHTYLDGTKDLEIELTNIKQGYNIGKSSLYINGNEVFTVQDNQVVPTGAGYYLLPSAGKVTFSTTPHTLGTITGGTGKTNMIINDIPLRRGDNIIEFTLFKDGQQVTKRSVSFFIEDSRTPKITEFKPVLIPKSPATRLDLTDPNSWADSDGISYSKQTGNHTTNDEKFDLIVQAYSVKQLEIVMDGVTVYTYKNPDTPTQSVSIENQNRTVGYNKSIVDGEERLTLRIQELDFAKSNIHTFVLKIVNMNGSMASLPMEFKREILPYLVKSPIPTVGKDIIVNRNYVPLYIQAENADEVIIGKEKAQFDKVNNWFAHTYIGLKENKWNKIKFTVMRGKEKVNGEVNVYYANTNQPGASLLAPVSGKLKVLNGLVDIKLPKGTLLRNREEINNRKPLYEGHNLLIGIADKENGLIESTKYNGNPADIHSGLRSRFSSLPNTFVPVSPIIYVNGGLGEALVGSTNYPPVQNGLQPHDIQNAFTDPLINSRALEPSKRGNITLAFDDNVRNTASTIVTVFRLDQDGRWRNVGGVVNKNSITVPFDEFGYYVAMKWRGSFEDASNHPWARNAIEVLYAKGYMNGKQQGIEFGTVDPVTRGEFSQLLVKALGLPLDADGTPTFIDVGENFSGRSGSMPHEEAVWEHKYIETAARAGIVRGYSGNIFLPNKSLTREEAALMIASALNLKMSKNDSKLREQLLKLYQDADKASFYSRPAIISVNKAKIMEGGKSGTSPDGKPLYSFYPSDTLTRAEAAVMIARLLKNQLKKLPKDFDTTNPNGTL